MISNFEFRISNWWHGMRQSLGNLRASTCHDCLHESTVLTRQTNYERLSQIRNSKFEIQNRLLSLLVLGICGTVLGIAAWLSPDPAGMGTHEQLGLPPCGFEMATGMPCATCGMTTAFAHAAHGQLIASFITQPAGMLLCMFMAIYSIMAAYTLVMGISLLPVLQLLWRPLFFLMLGVLIGLAWGYKIYMVHLGY
jgi:hypothetical protein